MKGFKNLLNALHDMRGAAGVKSFHLASATQKQTVSLPQPAGGFTFSTVFFSYLSAALIIRKDK